MVESNNTQINLFDQLFDAQHIDVLGTVENPVFIVNQICNAILQDKKEPWVKEIKKKY
jgi:hypothetical protein